ncbi:MAG: hypothetical protein AAGD10_13365 [Myxococcota bacterium]
MKYTLPLATALVCLLASPASARSTRPVHDPQGSVHLGLTLGGSFSSNRSAVAVGAQVGYAFIDGLVPGVRGLGFFGDFSGGEVAGFTVYTPPVSWPVVPYVVAEVGGRWESIDGADFSGVLAGGGGGLHLGAPGSRFSTRAGVVYNRWFTSGGVDIIRPQVLLTFSF